MFRVNLPELDRKGEVRVDRDVPADDPLWESTGLSLKDPVEIRLSVSATPTGQVVARGTLRARLERACRRCLEPVDPVVTEELALVWAVPDSLGDDGTEDDDGETRLLDPGEAELDLGPALREELLLAAPLWVLCREDCRGLCPLCGVNRNDEECECSLEEQDPRWDALRALKHD
jgi:uncharacterized protein